MDAALATATSFGLASLCCQSGLNAGDAHPRRDPDADVDGAGLRWDVVQWR